MAVTKNHGMPAAALLYIVLDTLSSGVFFAVLLAHYLRRAAKDADVVGSSRQEAPIEALEGTTGDVDMHYWAVVSTGPLHDFMSRAQIFLPAIKLHLVGLVRSTSKPISLAPASATIFLHASSVSMTQFDYVSKVSRR